jgi:hypothetical protein
MIIFRKQLKANVLMKKTWAQMSFQKNTVLVKNARGFPEYMKNIVI